jgi:hypothetical protein
LRRKISTSQTALAWRRVAGGNSGATRRQVVRAATPEDPVERGAEPAGECVDVVLEELEVD